MIDNEVGGVAEDDLARMASRVRELEDTALDLTIKRREMIDNEAGSAVEVDLTRAERKIIELEDAALDASHQIRKAILWLERKDSKEAVRSLNVALNLLAEKPVRR